MTEASPASPNGSGAMFDAIADRYDLVNRLISLGVDQAWRRKTIAALALPPEGTVLDLATGTADLAIMAAQSGADVQVIGLDPSERMMDVGREKIARNGLSDRVSLIVGTAEELPFDAGRFDGISIAFGIRNVPDRPKALREMRRVCRRGGRIAILELSEPRTGLLSPLARLHVHTIVPWLGSLLSGKDQYRYLQQSIAAFPSPLQFARMMEEAAIEVLEVHPLTFGVCQLYVGTPRGQA